MSQVRRASVVLLVLACLPGPIALGQMGGNRVLSQPDGMGGWVAGGNATGLPHLDPKIAEGYITIDGRAELRVQPTEMRIVLAVTSEAETAQKCQQAIDATVERLRAAWSKLGIAPENIVVDFIAVLPRYEWTIEKHDRAEVGVEKKVGFRMQTNVHLAVQKDSQAQAALGLAFEQGVTDIIAFDYWSKDLDDIKVKAREQALKAARGKSDALLGGLFHDPLPVINVQEQTTVQYPESLYHTVAQQEGETVREWNRDIPFIHAYRPRQSYYRGLYSDGNVQPKELAMKPEISVTSTVRLYFKSPASADAKKQEAAKPKEGEPVVPR